MENRRTILAIALVLFVWSGYNLLFPPAQKPQTEPEKVVAEKSVTEEKDQQVTIPVVAEPVVVQGNAQEKNVTVKSDLFDLVFTTNGARLIDIQLNKYREQNTEDSPFVKLTHALNSVHGTFRSSGSEGFYLPSDLIYTSSVESGEITLSQDKETVVSFQAVTPENIRVTKSYIFYPEKYSFDINIVIENISESIKKGSINFSLITDWNDSQKGDRYNFVGSVSFDGEDLNEDNPDKLKEESKTYSDKTLWTSFTTKYFATIISPTENAIDKVNISYNKNENFVENRISSKFFTLEPSKSTAFKYTGYIGPRDYDLLSASGKSFERIINLGFFGIIAHPLMVALKFFYGFLGNYGWAIVLLTVCIKAIFWPLTQKSYSSMKAMQKLQPQMQKLRSKHGKDKTKLNQEMMALYKENRVNPFGGCLPMLIQIPVFFALYKVLLEAIELRHAPFMLWITDLSAADTLISDALNLGFALGPLPLIMGVTMFFQQKMTPTNMDPTQAKIMLFMPVFFTFIFLSFPSGLVVYWLVNNLLTIAQQYLINRKPA